MSSIEHSERGVNKVEQAVSKSIIAEVEDELAWLENAPDLSILRRLAVDLRKIDTRDWKNIARPVMDTTNSFVDAFDKVIRFVNYFSHNAKAVETRTDKICLDTINKVEKNHQ